jgi:hypothetical protein
LYIQNPSSSISYYDIKFHNKAHETEGNSMLPMIAIAWIYVVLMAAVVEATSPIGTPLGALLTVLLYGVLPLGIVAYLFFSPARRRAQRAAQARSAARSGLDPDDRSHAAGDAVTPERKEP